MKTTRCDSKNAFFLFSVEVTAVLFSTPCITYSSDSRHSTDFRKSWWFHLGNITNGEGVKLGDSHWRVLDLPHDRSVEGEFGEDNPAIPGRDALPGGIG